MFEELLKRIAAALDAAGIPYMIIGGQAVLLYGEPRLTRDIDLTLGIGPDEVERMIAILPTLTLSSLTPNPKEFVQETMVLPCQDKKTGIRVDFIFSLTSYEAEALNRSKLVKMGTIEIRFASLEDLIIHKVIAGRPRDWEDVERVLAKNPQADIPFIEKQLSLFEESVDRPLLEPLRQFLKKKE
jgi:hypothetical protein